MGRKPKVLLNDKLKAVEDCLDGVRSIEQVAGVYADEGISGKSKRNRSEFLRMLKGAENKQIDLIITKSISRFARNTADCIETVRLLKSWNVGVYFEKENINTLNVESELMLAILSSVAEEELLSVSQNMKWSVSKRFQQGKVQVCTDRFMGYDKDEHGCLIINEKQARIVRRVFDDYISGLGVAKIAKALKADGVEKTTGGTNWGSSVVLGMLKNEKYVGDAILQKTITTNSITFKRKKNVGEMPMYVVRNHHPAIISREQFEMVKQLIKERSLAKGNMPDIAWKYQQRHAFTGKLECGQCGSSFKHTIHNSNANRQFYWACSIYISHGVSTCQMKTIKDDTVRRLFIRVFNRLLTDSEPIQKHLHMLKSLNKTEGDGLRIAQLEVNITELLKEERVFFQLQSKGIVDQSILKQEHEALVVNINRLRGEQTALQNKTEKEDDRYRKTLELSSIIQETKKPITEFSDELFEALVEKILVKERECLVFYLHGGLELEEKYTFKYGCDLV